MEYDYDVIIIGAGIHGAGAAQAAAAAGYSVLVLEQYDQPAQGSSSKSTKLIHGGLRYLETGQFHLVYECLQERSNLLRNAPHLVKLVPFYIPVYKNTTRAVWKIVAGLSLYSLFSRKLFKRIPRSQWSHMDGLKTSNLDAVFSYYDAQTDDARLTRSVLTSAQILGAAVHTGARFESARLAAQGCEIIYRYFDASKKTETKKVSARILVNAAGPWANDVLQRIQPKTTQLPVELVQGTHIIVAGEVSHPYYLEAPSDRRVVFVTPWKNQILIGTTENNYRGDPASVVPLDSEISYLLEVYNLYFEQHLRSEDVIGAFAGLRVLRGGSGQAFNRSRDTHLVEDRAKKPRVVTIYGGKLTSYRATSEQLLSRLVKTLAPGKRIADTRNLKLPDVE
ncbi:MAG: FAD-dependent oxidoreductase [Gammaproteobacteria bacterium]|nr:FAD-dependent oxidoreductase [Gammaproteobacteria bacterium]